MLANSELNLGNTKVLTATSDSTKLEDAFALSNLSTLLGCNALGAERYIYCGDYSDEFGDDPVYEVIVLQNELRLSSILPSCKSTPLDQFVFTDVTFTRQSFALPDGYGAGLHFNALLHFDQTCGDIYTVLGQVLGVGDPTLQVYCNLGFADDCLGQLKLSNFTLEGEFENIHITTPCNNITLTNLGARLLGFETTSHSGADGLVYRTQYGFAVFGSLEISASGWKKPIPLQYEISKLASTIAFEGTAEVDWNCAFGVAGLVLCDVSFTAELDLNQRLSSAKFGLAATLMLNDTALELFGSFSLQGDFSAGASIENLDWDLLEEIYQLFFGNRNKLERPETDFHLERATIVISSAGADHFSVELDVEQLNISDYPPASGTIVLGKEGIFVEVSLDGSVDVESFRVTNPLVSIDCRVGATSFFIAGDISWEGLELRARIHIYTDPGSKALQSTVVAMFAVKDQQRGIRLEDLDPRLRGLAPFSEVSLRNAAVVAASKADSVLPPGMTCPYPIREGIFVCATVGNLQVLSDVIGGKNCELTLAAGYRPGDGLALEMQTGGDMTLRLSDTVTTEPFTVKVHLGATPAFHICCGVKIDIGTHQSLRFYLDCALAPTDTRLSLSSYMLGVWENPFNLNPRLCIEGLLLSVSLRLAAGGTPDGFQIAGRIQWGETVLKVILSVDPKNPFFSVEVKKLTVKQLVSIVSTLADLDLPEPPDVLDFDHVELYACPNGAVILEKSYAPGFSFHCRMSIFGKVGEVRVDVGENGLVIAGSLDEFTLGGLTVTGNNGKPKASFKMMLTAGEQSGSFDGVLCIGSLCAELDANFQLRPNFTFKFHFVLRIDDLFFLRVDAGLASAFSPSSCDLSSGRYILNAEMEQHLIEYIRHIVVDGLKEWAQEVDRIAQKVRAEIANLDHEIDMVANRLKSWVQQGQVHDTVQWMNDLQTVLQEHIRLHSKQINQDAYSQFENRLNAYNRAKDEHEEALEEIEMNAAKGAFIADYISQNDPLAGAFSGFFHDLGETIGRIGTKVAHITTDRDNYKPKQVAYLRAQAELARVVADMLPYSLRQALLPQIDSLFRLADREERNETIQDIAELAQELGYAIISAVVSAVVDIAATLGHVLLKVADTAVVAANAAAQAALLGAAAVFDRILSLVDIKRIYLNAVLDTNNGGSVVFDAQITLLVAEESLTFAVHFNISDFRSFVMALLAWVRDWIKSNLLHLP